MLDRPSRAVAGEDGWIALRRAEGFVLVNEADGARWCGGAEPCRCWERGAEREERRRATVDHVPAALELRPAPERAHLVAEARQEGWSEETTPPPTATLFLGPKTASADHDRHLDRRERQRGFLPARPVDQGQDEAAVEGHPQGVASGVRERAG
jgi:hypothetical protein